MNMIFEGDMPGDKIEIHPAQIGISENVFKKVQQDLGHQLQSQNKIVISIYGGSGSGKSGLAVLLRELFKAQGIGCLVVSGDNYPRRFPKDNDALRGKLFDEEGEAGLVHYLGTNEELDYDDINGIIAKFKNGEAVISFKHMSKDEVWRTDVDVSDLQVMIIEWSHGNSLYIQGVDYPIYMHSTPEGTLQRRLKRGRNDNAASPLIATCLKIEQKKIEDRAATARIIVDMSGELISYEEYKKRYVKWDNRPMLNAYPDSVGGNMSGLVQFIDEMGDKCFSDVYLLPSIYHSDLDRGFSVIDYDIDENMGTMADFEALKAREINLKMDFILNHLSVNSPQFQDLLENGAESKYADFFINWNSFWEGCGPMNSEGVIEPEEKYIGKMFFRKPGLPILMVPDKSGKKTPYWNTFYQKVYVDEAGKECYLGQMDLNIKSEVVWDYYKQVLKTLADYGVKTVRLDAFAYASKLPGKKNFMNEPETWEVLAKLQAEADKLGLCFLPEIHASYGEKVYETIHNKGYLVYDFFLPGLIIDAIENKDATAIASWGQEIIEKNIRTVNMLGCHDGIPMLDLKGLVSEDRIQGLIDTIVSRGGMIKNLHGQKNVYYQVNATYFSALGEDEGKMLLARAIQMFMPGKPQVWYLDLLCGKNDLAAVEAAGADGHKEINRTNISAKDMQDKIKTSLVTEQLKLLKLRYSHKAFESTAKCEITSTKDTLTISWENNDAFAKLFVDFKNTCFEVTHS